MASARQASLFRSNTIANLRAMTFCAVSFFVGLQFKHLKMLFGHSDADGIENPHVAWAPEDMGEAAWPDRMSQQESAKGRRGETRTRREVGRPTRPLGGERSEGHGEGDRGLWKDGVDRQTAEKDGGKEKDLETRKERRREGRRRRRERRRNKAGNETTFGKKKKKSIRFKHENYPKDIEPLPWTLPTPTSMRDQTSEQFMADYVAAKRRAKIPLPWEQKAEYANKSVTLPLPIISLNFPKSATLTMKAYFDCGGITAVHATAQTGRIAVCMMENHLNDRPPLDGCETHRPRHTKDHLPIDFISDIGSQGPPCYYPALHDGGLENIARHYPNATVLLIVREAASWHRSMTKWGSIMHRWRKYCRFNAHDVPQTENMKHWRTLYKESTEGSYWTDFYRAHTQKIREFMMRHPALTYVEAELGDDMGKILNGYTGVPASCVMDCHPGTKWVKQNNATSKCHPVGKNPALRNAKPEDLAEENGRGEEDGSGNDDDDDDDDGGIHDRVTRDQEEDLEQ